MNENCNPLKCCDTECAHANNCHHIGGVACKVCGRYFCVSEIGDDGLCDTCFDERMEAAENEEEP